VKDRRTDLLLYSLDHTIELFGRASLPQGTGAAVHTALKEARAALALALAQEGVASARRPDDPAAQAGAPEGGLNTLTMVGPSSSH
jgi:hypothetical protein